MSYHITKEFAQGYDRYVREGGWHSPEVLFGLSYEFLCKGDRLLDIGIGTGLSACPFRSLGLEIYGIDHSEEMLKVCQGKGIARELKLIDVSQCKVPFANQFFNHVLASGLFHLLGELGHIFEEVSRCLAKDGFFLFTIDEHKPGKHEEYRPTGIEGLWSNENPDSGIIAYQHSNTLIKKYLIKNHLEVVKKLEFLAFKNLKENRSIHFSAYITQKFDKF